jgi:hypothetical protein
MNAPLSRRDFLKASGALVVGFSLVPELLARGAGRAALPGSLNTNRMLDAWLRVDPNGTVTIFTGKIELGQGIGTALAQIAADELDVDLKRIAVVSGDTSCTPNERYTAGSLSVQDSGTALRFACAEAREILITAAAAKLGVPAGDLRVTDATVVGQGGANVTYWDLAADADLKREATAKAKPKPASEHRWVGKRLPRRDIPKKFTGAHLRPGRAPAWHGVRRVVAAVTRCDAGLSGRRERAADARVIAVRDGSLGVAAEREEQAIHARPRIAEEREVAQSRRCRPRTRRCSSS